MSVSARVIVVEDNKINAQLFVDLLRLNGLHAHFILDGETAFEYISKNDADLLIVDIQLKANVQKTNAYGSYMQLQNISGIDIIKMIRSDKRLHDIPIIAVTAFASQQDEERILAAGASAYVSKPISIDHFMGVVNGFLEAKGEKHVA